MTGKIGSYAHVNVRFSIGTLLALITLLGMIFGIFRLLGPLPALMGALLLALIAAHLGAAYLGHRLGIGGRESHSPQDNVPEGGSDEPRPCPEAYPNLAERSALPAWQATLTTQVSIVGAAAGGALTTQLPPEEFNGAVMAISMLSLAALSGIASFLLGNFFTHAWKAIGGAIAGP